MRSKLRRLEPPARGQEGGDALAALRMPSPAATPLYSPLPSLGRAPGSASGGKPTVVRCENGVNEIIEMASGYPNQVVTPFSDPRIIDSKGDDDNLTYGNSVFITLNRDKPIAIWITDKRPGSRMCSLTLVPKPIPPQNIVLEIEGRTSKLGADTSPAAEETGRESQYIVNLRTLLRSVARNIVPRGFSDEQLNVGIAISNGIEAQPMRLYSGTDFDIYRYHLVNKNSSAVTLSEEAFGSKGVRAVAFYPRIQLAPGQDTDVFIVSDRADSSTADDSGGASQ
ncbi:TraK domain-containing protein [Burkholderia sp. MBR-1]|uniref:TraK domain-containing protein n=1 Tax=Burkholderia sp. MBR-1 TaxID=2732364 RepID=UPI0015EF9966|nr:type-F conjugative transfer system secretin TraK [Burkholderia sp. MBR-1]QMI49772.1 conjugal transfer protein TraK [Burkholderia sp. MBR-1]